MIVWASLALIRHATYWANEIDDRFARRMGPTYDEGFTFAMIEAAAETLILFSMLVIVLGHRHATRLAANSVRLLAAAFVLLALTDLVLNFDKLLYEARDALSIGRATLRVTWQVVSKLQLLAVPLVCALHRPDRSLGNSRA